MISNHMGNAPNLSSNVVFQTFQWTKFSLPSAMQHTTTITLSLYPSSPWHFTARVLWNSCIHWLWCNVRVHLSSNCCNNSLEHLKSMPIFSTISTALHSTVFTLQYCPFKVKQNSSISISSCWAPWTLMCFKISPCCKACCLIKSWFFKYVHKVKSGNPYSYAISLLLCFYHSPNDYSFPTIVLLMFFFSSLHWYSSFPHYVESKIQNIILW